MQLSKSFAVFLIEVRKGLGKPSLLGLILLPVAILLVFNYFVMNSSGSLLKIGLVKADSKLVSSINSSSKQLKLINYQKKNLALKDLSKNKIIIVADLSSLKNNKLTTYYSPSNSLSEIAIDSIYDILKPTTSNLRIDLKPLNIAKSSNLLLSTWLLFAIIVITTELSVIAIAEDRENKTLEALLVTQASNTSIIFGKTIFILLICAVSIAGLFLTAFFLKIALSFSTIFQTSVVLLLMALGLIGLGLVTSSFFQTVRQVRNISSYVLMIFFLPVALESLLPLKFLSYLTFIPSVGGKILMQSIFSGHKITYLYLYEITIFACLSLITAVFSLRYSLKSQ